MLYVTQMDCDRPEAKEPPPGAGARADGGSEAAHTKKCLQKCLGLCTKTMRVPLVH